MIDPVSVIVSALVMAVQAIGQEEVAQGYRELRDAIGNRYGPDAAEDVERLRREPESMARREALGQRLARDGALAPELVALADRLERIVRVQLDNETPVERAERIRWAGGVKAFRELLNRHISRIHELRDEYPIDDRDLLVSNIRNVGSAPAALRDDIGRLHYELSRVINQVAGDIAAARYGTIVGAVSQLEGSMMERQRADAIVAAHRGAAVSLETLRLSIAFFGEINQRLLDEVEQARDPRQQLRLMFANAVLVYELADFTITQVKNFAMPEDLERVHKEVSTRMAALRAQQERFLENVSRPQFTARGGESYRQEAETRAIAIDALEGEWNDLLTEVRGLDTRARDLKENLEIFQVIRDNAQIQIEFLQLVRILRFLKDSMDSLRKVEVSMGNLRLAPLDTELLKRVIQI